MYEAYLVKGDRVLPASCHGGSLLPSLWHSFSLSLSGGEAGRVREGSKKKIQKYEEMACKRKKSQSDMPWQRHRGGERRDKAEKQQNVWECRRMGERGRWKHKHETLEMLHPWYCHAVFSFHLKSTKCTHTDTHKLSRSHSSLQHSDSLFSRATHTTLTKQVNCFTHCFHKPHLKTSNVCCRFFFFLCWINRVLTHFSGTF